MRNAVSYDDLILDGCIDIFGSHIKLCIEDFASVHKKIERIERTILKYKRARTKLSEKKLSKITYMEKIAYDYYTAKAYIFGLGLSGGLREDIARLELPINLEYIRNKALKQAEKGNFNSEYFLTEDKV